MVAAAPMLARAHSLMCVCACVGVYRVAQQKKFVPRRGVSLAHGEEGGESGSRWAGLVGYRQAYQREVVVRMTSQVCCTLQPYPISRVSHSTGAPFTNHVMSKRHSVDRVFLCQSIPGLLSLVRGCGDS